METLRSDDYIELAPQLQLVQVGGEELDVHDPLALRAGARVVQRLAAAIDRQDGARPTRDLHRQRARSAAQIGHVELRQQPPERARPELERLSGLEQPLVDRLP